MINLELTEHDGKMLSEILSQDLSDLRMEISHTDRLAYREGLKERKELLAKLLDQLDEGLAS